MNLLHTIHGIEQTASKLFAKNAPSGVTVRQAVIMAALKAKPGVSQTDLVESTGVDRSTLADVVRRLCKRGWLERRRNRQDTRAYIVNLTQEGNKVLATARSSAARAEKELAIRIPSVKSLVNGH